MLSINARNYHLPQVRKCSAYWAESTEPHCLGWAPSFRAQALGRCRRIATPFNPTRPKTPCVDAKDSEKCEIASQQGRERRVQFASNRIVQGNSGRPQGLGRPTIDAAANHAVREQACRRSRGARSTWYSAGRCRDVVGSQLVAPSHSAGFRSVWPSPRRANTSSAAVSTHWWHERRPSRRISRQPAAPAA